MKKIQILWILAFLFAGISCSDDTETDDTTIVPETEQIDMKEVADTEWQSGEIYDFYRIILATGATQTDTVGNNLVPQNDGYALTVVLTASPASDVAHPVLPIGEYTLSSAKEAGLWQSAQLTRKIRGKIENLTLDEGKFIVDSITDGYSLNATFRCGEQGFTMNYTGALTFKGDESIHFELNTIIQTNYAHNGQVDDYMAAIATSPVVFDEETFVFRTEGDGYVMYLNLLSEPSADPSNPQIPNGTYKAGKEVKPGVWYLENGMGVLIGHTTEGGVKVEQINSGTLESIYNGFDYTFKAHFTTDAGKTYASIFNGELTFQGIAADDSKLTEPVDTKFVGGQACYLGADNNFPTYGLIRLELWDGEPDPELGTVYGNMVKAHLNIDLPTGTFNKVPAGTYNVSPSVGAFMAQPGYDDGVNIPTGTYIAQTLSADAPMKLAMIDGGSLTITADGQVSLDLVTSDGISVRGTLDKPLEIFDLSNQGGNGDSGEEPEVPEGPYSALTGDKVINLNDINVGYLYEYGDLYGNGTRNIVIQVLSAGSMSGFLLDLALPGAEPGTPLTEGTYHVADVNNEAYTFAPGSIFGPNAIGTWPYVDLYVEGEYTLVDFKTSGNAVDGTLEISRQGETYTFTFDLLDDAASPHHITGSWTGTLQNESYTAAPRFRNVIRK